MYLRIFLLIGVLMFSLLITGKFAFAQNQSDANVFTKNGPTALGLINCETFEPSCVVDRLLTLGLSVVGGLAFLLLILGSFRILTSTGNPESLNEGREIIISAIAGLIFVVFSVVLLKIIGRDIFPIF